MDDRAVFTLPDPPPAPIENIKKLQRRNLNIFNLPGQTAQHQTIRSEVAVSHHQVFAAGNLMDHVHLQVLNKINDERVLSRSSGKINL